MKDDYYDKKHDGYGSICFLVCLLIVIIAMLAQLIGSEV